MLTLIESLGLRSLGVGGGCLEGWTGESKAVDGSTSIISTSMDDIDILCVGPTAMSGVWGSSLGCSGAFVFIMSKVGVVSSPGLVVGEAVSGPGVCDDGLPFEEVGDDCASWASIGGGMTRLLSRCLFGDCGTSVSTFAIGAASSSLVVSAVVGLPTSSGTVSPKGAPSSLRGLASPLASSCGRVEVGRDGACERGEPGRLAGCNDPLRLGWDTRFGGDLDLLEVFRGVSRWDWACREGALEDVRIIWCRGGKDDSTNNRPLHIDNC